MNCEYIWSGLFEFNSSGAAFRHDLNQFALWSSAIWAVWLLIPVIGTRELNWFGSSDFTEQSFCCLSARWDSFNCFIWCCLVGRLDEEPESGGVWLLFWISSVFPCFFCWRSISYNRKVCTFQSLFPLCELISSLLIVSFLCLSWFVVAVSNCWICNNEKLGTIQHSAQNLHLIDCLFSSTPLLSKWVLLISVTFLF